MITRHYVITAIVMSLIAVIAGLILSMGNVAYAGSATLSHSLPSATLVSEGGYIGSPTLAPNIPLINNELYESKNKLICVTCPVSLPPTSGNSSEAETLFYIVSDFLSITITNVYSSLVGLFA
jgi:hypothetical protein